MVSPFAHLLGDSQSEPHFSDYTSNALRLFLKGLEQVGESHILDLGPVCGENITFFTRRVKRLYVCDMFFHLRRGLRETPPRHRIWEHLDYPPGSLHGILSWNLLDHLDDREGGRTAELCYEMLKPGGMLFAALMGKRSVERVAGAFGVKDGCRLHMAHKTDMDLPLHVRNNREVLELLHQFTPMKSFLYQNGLREYLFKRD